MNWWYSEFCVGIICFVYKLFAFLKCHLFELRLEEILEVSQKLFEGIKRHSEISPECQIKIAARLTRKTIKKKQYYLHEGQIAKSAAFVLSGCLRSYSIDENGFEHILQFAPQNWWITDMYSYISEKECYLNINALEDTEVLLLTRRDQLNLFDEVPALERYFRIITENSLVNSHRRLLDNLALPAKDRYLKFCQVYPTLVNTLPQKQIAQYLGITPEFLSKVRNESYKKR